MTEELGPIAGALQWLAKNYIGTKICGDVEHPYSAAYSDRPIHAIPKPELSAVSVASLQGIVDYYAAHKPDDVVLVVDGVESVRLVSKPFGAFKQRDEHCSADAITGNFHFGSQYDTEKFIIALQSEFVQDETTAAILKLVGNLSDEKAATFEDDGVTQKVSVRAGVSRVGYANVPNPVILRPFRTFSEVEQPASAFVFRIKSGAADHAPTCSLHSADGERWRIESIANIKNWLKENLQEVPVIG